MMIICDTCVGIHIRIYNKEVLVMSASKDTKRGTWKVYIRYKDWQGVGQVHTKRGFATKREALEYEREFLLKKSKDVNMGFPQFVEVYMEDMKPRLKLNTFLTKKHIMETKIIPYFEKKSLAGITATDVIQWQNQLLSMRDENGMPYAQTYLRTIQNQLSAIFNHACRFYGLTANPSKQAGKMGKAKGKEMLFWTKEEYLQFSEVMKDKPVSYYAFEVLYWTGIREGELLALERGDFNIPDRKLTINKSYQHLQGKDYITSPKTEKSNRVIELPEFLCREMEDYFGMLYKCDEHTRLFTFSKSYLHHEMDRGAIGKFGHMRCEYLKEFKHGYYMELLLDGRLNEYLHGIDEACYEMRDRLVEKMKEKQGVTEQLKAENQMMWVGKMNNIIACAEEVVVMEVVYV